MPRTHRFILAQTLVLAGLALAPLRAEEEAPLSEPQVVLTDAVDLGESLLVAPATASEQLDAAERLAREFGPEAFHDAIPSGRWRVSPHLEASVTYDDNIFIQPDHEVEDFIFALSPGLAIGIWDSEKRRTDGFLDRQDSATVLDKGRGTYFVADYTAILLGFEKTDSQNAFDQDARLNARVQAEKWSLRGDFRYESKSEANVDIGTRIRRRTLSAEVVAIYRVSQKTTIDASASLRANDPEDFVRSTGWKVETEATHELTPLVRVGLGAAVGGVAIDGGADDVFERMLARATYQYSEKLGVEARGGVEFRQSDGRAGDRVNPIFSVLVSYDPAAGTRVGLEAFRTVETSEFRPEESYERTGVTASFHRALRAGFHVQFDAGYAHSEYSTSSNNAGRRDDYFFARPRLLWNFSEWGNAVLAYEYRSNDSNRAEFNFDNNQITFQVNILY